MIIVLYHITFDCFICFVMDVIERSCLVVNAKFSFVYFSISLHLSTLFS